MVTMGHMNSGQTTEPGRPVTMNYCECETPIFDPEHDAGCRRCGLAIDFTPADPECEGHPAGAFDAMGETVYCDGSCKA